MFWHLVFFLASLAVAADTAAWRSRNIYFALTDRIARTESDNGGSACGDLGNYCGGTFKGLEGKLDYIKGLGFDAIWITPVIKSMLHVDGSYSTNTDVLYHRQPERLSWLLGSGSLFYQRELRDDG